MLHFCNCEVIRYSVLSFFHPVFSCLSRGDFLLLCVPSVPPRSRVRPQVRPPEGSFASMAGPRGPDFLLSLLRVPGPPSVNMYIFSQFLRIAHFPRELFLGTLIVATTCPCSDKAKVPAFAGSHSDACLVCSDWFSRLFSEPLVAGGENQTRELL